MLAYGAFEEVQPAFAPTPMTPNPQTIRTNHWVAAMHDEINNMRRLNVFEDVPRPKYKNIITPQWIFRCKFENGMLIKYKARLVACGFTQVPGIDYHEARLYAPVVRLESLRALITIAALFDLELRQFDVSAAYLHGEIDEEVYMEPPPRYQKDNTVWRVLKGLLRTQTSWPYLARVIQGRYARDRVHPMSKRQRCLSYQHLEKL